ncbi:MAG: DUF1295 domain-containing protein [Saprospiraceae bacterium]|nr:DUF1295 domain-containing protein [Saprospiraceae bacterium]
MNLINTSLLLILSVGILLIMALIKGINLNSDQAIVIQKLITICLSVSFLCFLISELTKNYSQVDKLWSILPILYVWIVAYHGDFQARLVYMSILVTLWGLRLSYNFSLKGAYSWKFWQGEEDYRWKVLRQRPEFQPGWKWSLFNLGFISIYQNLLIFSFTTPILFTMQYKDQPFSIYDYGISATMLGFILMETIADIQQWKFQSKKWRKIKSGETLSAEETKGFLDKGLWKYCRHPNYFAEQCIWVCFYLFSVSAGGSWINWSICGSLLLILLFQGSAQFSEEISVQKYPAYKKYQQEVNKFLPFRFG